MKLHILPRFAVMAAAAAIAWPVFSFEMSAATQEPVATAETATVTKTAADVLAMTRQECAAVTELSLTGQVSPEVLAIIRDQMWKLVTLNLEGTTMTEIPAFAFAGMDALKTVTLPSSVTVIGDGAFATCRKLATIQLPASVTTIGKLAFSDTNIRRFTIPASATSVAENFLFDCDNLLFITVEEGNPNYCNDEAGTLYNADKTRLIRRPAKGSGVTLTIPEGVKTIAPHACASCVRLTSVVFPEGLTTIGDYAFQNCKKIAGQLTIPASVTSIGKGAFTGCIALKESVTLPATVKLGGEHVFSYLSGINTIVLADGVTSIPASTFELCRGVKTIKSASAVPPTVGTMAFRGINRSTTFVDVTNADAYKAADVWNEFSNYEGVAESLSYFSTDGQYRIKYVGEGAAKGKFINFSEDKAMATLSADEETASVWTLEFFTVNHSALPFVGEQGSDILFVDGDRTKHINMAGLCWNDPSSGYGNNANRTFGFYLADTNYKPAEGPVVAIRGNGTLWDANDAGTQLVANSYSASAPTKKSFVWQLVPYGQSSITDIEESAQGTPSVYNLSGMKVSGTPAHGVYIRVWPNGRTEKVTL